MIPMEVAEIATVIRNEFNYEDTDEEFQHSIKVAWKIYNQLNLCKCV